MLLLQEYLPKVGDKVALGKNIIKGGRFKDPDTGELQKRAGTDFVIEVPKTVSMMYASTDSQDLKEWIMKTQSEVEKLSFDYLESQTGA